MRVAVVGGKLQGVEATYLAKKAGWEVVLIDKKPEVPAVGLCDTFLCIDVTQEDEFKKLLNEVHLIIPALENQAALNSLELLAKQMGLPLAYDPCAYSISSSKVESNLLFERLGVPLPRPWPECNFPVIVKPSGASGSQGVCHIRNSHEFTKLSASQDLTNDWVIQEFLDGPSFSIEVLGWKGEYKVLQITELEMDAQHDCKRVLVPALLSYDLKKQLKHSALEIARELELSGIMDVEVILHNEQLKVLEIDARLPSQTPTAVYKSSGINMIELLGKVFSTQEAWADIKIVERKGVVYEHIKVTSGKLEVGGEHIMSEAGPLHLCNDFFGADEAITNYQEGKEHWAATLIVTGDNRQEAWNKRCGVINSIREKLHLYEYADPFPAV